MRVEKLSNVVPLGLNHLFSLTQWLACTYTPFLAGEGGCRRCTAGEDGARSGGLLKLNQLRFLRKRKTRVQFHESVGVKLGSVASRVEIGQDMEDLS